MFPHTNIKFTLEDLSSSYNLNNCLTKTTTALTLNSDSKMSWLPQIPYNVMYICTLLKSTDND